MANVSQAEDMVEDLAQRLLISMVGALEPSPEQRKRMIDTAFKLALEFLLEGQERRTKAEG